MSRAPETAHYYRRETNHWSPPLVLVLVEEGGRAFHRMVEPNEARLIELRRKLKASARAAKAAA